MTDQFDNLLCTLYGKALYADNPEDAKALSRHCEKLGDEIKRMRLKIIDLEMEVFDSRYRPRKTWWQRWIGVQ